MKVHEVDSQSDGAERQGSSSEARRVRDESGGGWENVGDGVRRR